MIKKMFIGVLALGLGATSCSDDDSAIIIPDAGVLSGGPFTFVVDGIPDNVSGIATDSNAIGSNSTFVVTDDLGNILGLPPTNEALEDVDFDVAGVGTCLIWYLRYESGLQGLETSMNANNLQGSFDWSNSITVNRNPEPNAGTLLGGPFTFCVDGEADNVSGISTDSNATGTNSTFVITDDTGIILGMPPSIEALEGVNFDSAGAGICLIWYLRFEEGLVGAEMGMNANNLSGSFSLSNSITVVRNEPNAGTLVGGPFNFTVDGTVDNVSGISTDSNATGSNGTFLVTDDTGEILGMPPTIEALEGVDFDGAGVGVCLIWYLRYEDGLQGAVMGENANDLIGCFNLSNSITVTRN